MLSHFIDDLQGRHHLLQNMYQEQLQPPSDGPATASSRPDISTVVKVTDDLYSLGSDVVIKLEPSEWFGAWRCACT